jgi:hypothetical protein
MRLTLRTLLAYMDGLLDAKDSQEIGKKIEDSKFASELFHKIRDVMRRLRLAAPSLTERAANLDCNTVAEYLDNALPSDRVPDFEEVSLKSEMHLAEVASCHQILTMVLGEPVEIDPESRQRMYQLPTVANRVDEEHLAAVEAATMLSGDGNPSGSPASSIKARPRPVVPEYLRDPPRKSRLLPTAAIMLFVGAAIGLILMMLGQFNAGTPLGNALLWAQAKMHGKPLGDDERDEGDTKRPVQPFSSDSAKSPAGSSAGPNGSAASKPTVSTPAGSAAKDTGNPQASAGKSDGRVSVEKPSEGVAPGKLPMESTSKSSGAAITPGPPQGATQPPGKLATTPTGPEAGPAAPEKSRVPSVANHGTATVEPRPMPHGDASTVPPAVKPQVEVASLNPNSASKTGTTLPPVGPANAGPTAADKLKLGRFISDGQDVLLKFEPGKSGWQRALPEEFLAGRQPLLALPSYRPRVAILNVGATLELVNGTRIELVPENPQGQAGVDIDFGRVVIRPMAQAGARLRVSVGSHTGTITLTSVESIAALEVTRVNDPGADPEKVLSHTLTKLYVARGGALWEESEGKPMVRLTAPAELLLDGVPADTSAGASKEIPRWITTNTVNDLDQREALAVSQALRADRAASLGLMELTEDRRKEIRWLAVRCLGYLGQFDPMTAALNELDFRREWFDYVDQLKEAIARGPETAAGIRRSLEKQYGNDSATLYRMLWGYTDKQLEDGEDARLVKFLEHESPVFRVLAFENLNAITHQGLYYRPEATAAKRQPSVQQWWRQQKMGRIRSKLPEAKPRSAPADLSPRKAVPESPKPGDDGQPAELRPIEGAQPLVPGEMEPGDPSNP